MPAKSKAQWRHLFAAEARGELPRGTARRFAHETRVPFARLPERAHHSPVEPEALARLLRQSGFWTPYEGYRVHARTGHRSAAGTVYFVAETPGGDIFSVVAYDEVRGVFYLADSETDLDAAADSARRLSERWRASHGS